MLITKEYRQQLVAMTRDIRLNPFTAQYPHSIICGPSGSGKSTLIRNDPLSIMNLVPNSFDFLVSGATRAPRPWEIDGVDYDFMSNTKFGSTEFFETNEYTGNSKLYGTKVTEIERVVKYGKKRMLLDIDPNGAIAFQEEFGKNSPDLFVMFLLTSRSVLKQRLIGRLRKTEEMLTDEEREEIEKRLDTAEKEKQMVEKKIFVPDFILPYDDVRVGEAANSFLVEACKKFLGKSKL